MRFLGRFTWCDPGTQITLPLYMCSMWKIEAPPISSSGLHGPEAKWFHFTATKSFFAGAFYVGLLDGLLGVAGMMTLLVMDWIIPENSLLSTSKIFGILLSHPNFKR